MESIKSEFLVQDPLSSSITKPIYDVDLGQDVIYLSGLDAAAQTTVDIDRFHVPLLKLEESFDVTYKQRKVHPKVDIALDILLEKLFTYPKTKRIRASTYLDAHVKASTLLENNNVGHIFVKDRSKAIVIDHYDFNRRISSAPFLPEHTLMFVPDPEYFGVIPISNDGLEFGAAIILPQNTVIAECESIK